MAPAARTGPARPSAAGGPDDGAAGEGDELIDVETLGGGSGDDLLRASSTTTFAYLYGGPGSDSLIGSAKSDYLDGGPNSDAYFADAGDDAVIANDGAPDHVDCGAGQNDFASLDTTEQGVFQCEVRQ